MLADTYVGTMALGQRQNSLLTGAVAVVASIVALIPLPGVAVFTGSAIVFMLLLPIMLSFIRLSKPLVRLAVVCVAVTILSPLTAVMTSGTLDGLPRWDWVARPIAVFISAVTITWCAREIGIQAAVLLAIPAPMVFDLITRSGQGNDWKYAVSVWVTVGVLMLVSKWQMPWKVAAVLAIIAVSAANDTRGIIAMAAVAFTVELLTRTSNVRVHRVLLSSIGAATLAITAFQLAVAGAFGSRIQATMLLQTQSGPMSLLRSARPESAGNIALIFSDPMRFEISDAVTSDQAAIIRDSFAQVSRDPNSAYVSRNILNDAELHSIASDLWLHLGFIGIVLSFSALAFYLMLGIRAFKLRSYLTAVVVFISLRGCWDILFSPISDLRFWPLYICIGLFFFGKELSDEHPR